MKDRAYLVGVLIVVLLFLGCWWFWTSKRVPPADAPVKASVASSANTVVPSGTTSQALQKTNPALAPPPAATPVDPKVAAFQAVMDAENSKALDFYGKAIDQFGNPVSGVKVKAGVGLILGFDHSGGNYYYTETGTNGLFSFVGIHGAGMGLTLTKEDYVYNQRLPSSSRLKDYIPDSNQPVIFPMWKLKGAEPMVHAKVHAYVPCDGAATSYDILTGHKVADGDLVLTLARSPVQIVRGHPFDWKATAVLTNGGGFVAISDTYPNEAPSDGYQPKITIEMPAATKNWDAAFVRSYYFTCENGKIYGRLTLSIQADYQPPPTSIDVEIYANPSGSRSLEFDPAKEIKP